MYCFSLNGISLSPTISSSDTLLQSHSTEATDSIIPSLQLDTDTQHQSPINSPISKNKQKKLLKLDKYMAQKDATKIKRKKLRLEKKERSKQDPLFKKEYKPKRIPHKYQTPLDINLIIDLEFDDLMTDKDINSLARQLKSCYSSLNVQSPLKLCFAGMHDKCRDYLRRVCPEYQKWRVDYKTTLLENVDQSQVVYLTADSENVLRELVKGESYVIGGLVDHNYYPKCCLKKALEMGVRHARLPINEYMVLKSRSVLTVNNVVEIMQKFADCNDWKQAFVTSIPSRKVDNDGIVKTNRSDNSDTESADTNTDDKESLHE